MIEIERTSDVLDVASQLSDALTEAALEDHRHRNKPEQVQNPDGTWPVTECACGEPLGVRATLGKILCIDCQTLKERRRA